MKIAIVGLIAVWPLAAQETKLPANLEKAANKAANVVDINMDGPMLQLASKFLSDKDPDEAKVKKLVSGLKSISVKSFEFEGRSEYDPKDLEELRAQWKGPGWSRIVGVRSKNDGGNAEVYLKSDGNQITGIAILVADPNNLTIVSVNGTIRPEDVQDLPGHFGIPKVDLGKSTIHLGGKAKEDNK